MICKLLLSNFYREMEELKEKIISFKTLDFYKVLVDEKKGMPIKSFDEQKMRKYMKAFLMKIFKTDDIEKVDYEILKKFVDGGLFLSRLKYRSDLAKIMHSQRDVFGIIQKQKIQELEEDQYNADFGFKCLNYSVSESNKFVELTILNKNKKV